MKVIAYMSMQLEEIKQKLAQESEMDEGLLVGYFWNDPELYGEYNEDAISYKTFLNEVWQFYFELGRVMYKEGMRKFGVVDVEVFVKNQNEPIQKAFDQWNGYETIKAVMEVTDGNDNFQIHYDKVKKYYVVFELSKMFGEKVITPTSKYDYRKMTSLQVHTYWMDKLNNIAIDSSDNGYEEYDLLDDLKAEIDEWDKNPDYGLPFYKSSDMTKICNGWALGHLYLFGAFGGSGKTSFTISKIVMACIEAGEKLLIIANEQSKKEFAQMLLITAMGVLSEPFNRQRLNEGNFTDEEKMKLYKAAEWINSITKGNYKLIKLVFMNSYVMEDVKRVIRKYANRGYKRVIVDTAKPSEGSQLQRWERFTEDMKQLYSLARSNGGGLNLAIWASAQLSDSALKQRFLNEYALGESKKAKNETSVVFMMRAMWDDEYMSNEESRHELTCYKYVKRGHKPFSDYEMKNGYYALVGTPEDVSNRPYIKYEFKINKKEPHYLLFTAKNRRGRDYKTGLDVLVLRPNFNNNQWVEVGWTKVYDDRNY